MRAIKFTSWQEDSFFMGFLNEYPDYQTQGLIKERARNNLSKFMLRQAQHERWWRLSCSSYFMYVPKEELIEH
jgi:hypothetical protein